MSAVEALWLPMLAFGLMWLAAIPLARAWQARASRRPNPYLSPWADRKPGDMS